MTLAFGEERRKVVHGFMNDPEVLVLIANDAAGEGVNLQRAHLMVNYDLPWNPNRLEQRFGRIHRIGQAEVCHLWNLLAKDTREGDVYARLLEKLEAEREALGGKVFDVIGQLFDEKPLRQILMDAVCHNNDPETRARVTEQVEGVVDRSHLQALLDRRALVNDSMDTTRIQEIKEDMERAHARRLQPHFIEAFFLEAFKRLGGKIHRRETGRYEITHVPASIRESDRQRGDRAPVLKRYERVCFEKDHVEATPRAELICPGSPLLDATIDVVLGRDSDVLKQGAVLVDPNDAGTEPRILFYLQHAIRDGRRNRHGLFHTISEKMQFIEVGKDGDYRNAGEAPYLNYRPVTDEERTELGAELDAEWMRRDWDNEVLGYAIANVVPAHVDAVKEGRLAEITKVEQQVKSRLKREVAYWDHRAQDLRAKERAGKQTRLPASQAEDRANNLSDRLRNRLAALEKERLITPAPPELRGGALIIPIGLLQQHKGEEAVSSDDGANAEARSAVEQIAVNRVMATERELGRIPRDRGAEKIGYDVESKDPETGLLHFIEVKGRYAHARSITVTRNEILYAKNNPERHVLAIVLVDGDSVDGPHYVRGFDYGEPSFAAVSQNLALNTLMEHAEAPS